MLLPVTAPLPAVPLNPAPRVFRAGERILALAALCLSVPSCQRPMLMLKNHLPLVITLTSLAIALLIGVVGFTRWFGYFE